MTTLVVYMYLHYLTVPHFHGNCRAPSRAAGGRFAATVRQPAVPG